MGDQAALKIEFHAIKYGLNPFYRSHEAYDAWRLKAAIYGLMTGFRNCL